MFCGAYWSQRSESRADAAARVVSLLKSLERKSDAFSRWSLKKSRKSKPTRALEVNEVEVARHLDANRKDIGNSTFAELGFRIALWNDLGASLSITIGSQNPHVRNAVALSYDGGVRISESDWKDVLQVLVDTMKPEHAGVATERSLADNPQKFAWHVGWLSYERHGEIVQHARPEG